MDSINLVGGGGGNGGSGGARNHPNETPYDNQSSSGRGHAAADANNSQGNRFYSA